MVAQPPQLPSSNITEAGLLSGAQPWFEYMVRVSPHHTDYSNAAWHGTYLTWMEEARVEALRSIGIEYADLVALGCELPVVDLAIRYHKAVRMGQQALVRCRMAKMEGVRLIWDYEIHSIDRQHLYTTAQVTLVAIDLDKGRILRQLPPQVKDALARMRH
jgi:acyl-CoA thioester hydrolase